MRFAVKTALISIAVLLAYPAWLGFQIWQQSHRDDASRADAIVVLGAAQYDGRPSDVFKARLDHAAYLYRQDFSDRIIVTGGKQPGDRFTEGEAGVRYLGNEGVPLSALGWEGEGLSTLHSLERVWDLAAENDLRSVLLVSDPLHSERIRRMAHDLGFQEIYTSPASYVELHRSRTTKAKELLHEVGSVILYEFLDR